MEAGFEVYLTPDERIGYFYKGKSKPDMAKIKDLLNELKEKKAEAVAYLKKEVVCKLLKEAREEVNSKAQNWEEVFEYVKTCTPKLDHKIDEAQERIDNLWKENKSLGEIKKVIREWKNLNMEAFRLLNLKIEYGHN